MNDADRHLIVGLIDGSLSPEDTEAARARLDTDAEFATAHAEQLAVRSVLTAEAVPSMTSIERQGLRTGLMAHLNLETTPTPATTTKRRKRWLTPVMGLAAATAVVAGFAIIPSMLSSSDGDSAAAPAIVSRDLPEDSSAPSIESDGSNAGGELYADGEPVEVVDVAGADLESLLDATKGDDTPGEVEAQLGVLGYKNSVSIDGSVLERCIETLRPDLPTDVVQVFVLGADTTGTHPVAHIALSTADGITAAVSVDLDSCSIVDDGD